jgi:acetyl-CoA carboxylase biotin carboxyl carrier protein
MIDPKNLKALVRLMVENDLTELDLQDAQGERVALKRGRTPAPALTVPTPPLTIPATVAPPAAPPAGDAGLTPIKSPIVGTFYAAASPEAKPLVAVGDRVGPETVVCIIEAMKVFNEIKADASGVVEKILASNGQAVEFGQPLFLIRPT